MPTGKEHSAPTSSRRVLVVEDHPIVRQGLVELIEHEPDLSVFGVAANGPEALQALADEQPDIAIVDLSLQDTSGTELIKDIKARYPQLPVLVLSMHDEALYAERVLRAGARGYIMKEEATERVMTAVRTVLRGEVYLSEKMSARILRKLVDRPLSTGTSPAECLSDRELQVFELIGRGMGTRQVAETLHLSVKTIETHREHIKAKLHVANSTKLLQCATQWVNMEGPK